MIPCKKCGMPMRPREARWNGDPMTDVCADCEDALSRKYVDHMIREGARPQTPGSRYTGD